MKSSAEQTEKSPNTDSTLSTGSNNTMYEKLPNISIVFHDKLPHYFLGQTVIVSKSTVSWMKHIASGRYQDSEIHKILSHVNTLKEEGNFSEAAQLMLVCGLTESNLGRLVFARELIKGDIFEKNETQAFELIKELALSGYDEAICDYGQLVEHGIGTEADSKYAEELYKEAVSMDLERGRRLYENIRKKNHKFLSFLRG
jgi:TPR repeat protein